MVDTAMAGQRELNAVYVIAGPEPTLVEAGAGAPTARSSPAPCDGSASAPTTSRTSS